MEKILLCKALSYYDELNLGCSCKLQLGKRVGRGRLGNALIWVPRPVIAVGASCCRPALGRGPRAPTRIRPRGGAAPCRPAVCKFESAATATHSITCARVRVPFLAFRRKRGVKKREAIEGCRFGRWTGTRNRPPGSRRAQCVMSRDSLGTVGSRTFQAVASLGRADRRGIGPVPSLVRVASRICTERRPCGRAGLLATRVS